VIESYEDGTFNGKADRERRIKRRFQIDQEVKYKMLYGQRIAETGSGMTTDISSSGVRFNTVNTLSAGMPIEIIAREIQPLEGLREQSAKEVLIAPPNFDTFDEAAMGEILRRHPGSIPVSLEMRRSGQFAAPLRLSPRFWVRPTPEFTASMETLLGRNSVRYSYAASP